MAMDTKAQTIRPLTKLEIDRRIGLLLDEVMGADPAEDRQPRWVSPADLVRRLSRFLVYN